METFFVSALVKLKEKTLNNIIVNNRTKTPELLYSIYQTIRQK